MTALVDFVVGSLKRPTGFLNTVLCARVVFQ